MVVLMCNLKPAKMRGIVSQAMVMCANCPEKVEIIDPPAGSVPGDRIVFEGYPGEIFKHICPIFVFYPIKSVKRSRSGTFDAMSSNWALHQSLPKEEVKPISYPQSALSKTPNGSS